MMSIFKVYSESASPKVLPKAQIWPIDGTCSGILDHLLEIHFQHHRAVQKDDCKGFKSLVLKAHMSNRGGSTTTIKKLLSRSMQTCKNITWRKDAEPIRYSFLYGSISESVRGLFHFTVEVFADICYFLLHAFQLAPHICTLQLAHFTWPLVILYKILKFVTL